MKVIGKLLGEREDGNNEFWIGGITKIRSRST